MPPARKKQKTNPTQAAAGAAAAAPTTAAARKEWQAEKLTGNRMIKGRNAGGEPNYVYEVKWAGYPASANTWEPASNLVGWESDMKNIDEKFTFRSTQSSISVKGAALAAREAAAKQKQIELKDRRDRLQRMKRRRAARSGSDDGEGDDNGEGVEDDETIMIINGGDVLEDRGCGVWCVGTAARKPSDTRPLQG